VAADIPEYLGAAALGRFLYALNRGMSEQVKEIMMDVKGGGETRRKGRKGRRSTAKAQEGGGAEEVGVGVQKTGAEVAVAPAPAPATSQPELAAVGGGKPTVVIAPAKKKPAKVMLVPKSKTGGHPHRLAIKKTFKAKRVCLTIDNTAKTRKHRQAVLQKVDSMSTDQLRAAAVAARLSRRESVAKVPEKLLRQMVRDYQTMKGMLL
jgi:hypothetical protein